MKLSVLLLCSVLLLSVSVLSQEEEATAAEQEIPGTRDARCGSYTPPICTRERVPVCGSNGVTYGNECTLCTHNLEKRDNVRVLKEGECDPQV